MRSLEWALIQYDGVLMKRDLGTETNTQEERQCEDTGDHHLQAQEHSR